MGIDPSQEFGMTRERMLPHQVAFWELLDGNAITAELAVGSEEELYRRLLPVGWLSQEKTISLFYRFAELALNQFFSSDRH